MNRLDQLKNWVNAQHAAQFVKKTQQPYFEHLLFVAEISAPLVEWGYETGLCHDLLEKTIVTQSELAAMLLNIGYNNEAATIIVTRVIELTNVFTKTAYPKLTKTERKVKEAVRLAYISPGAQTVKYADLIYNAAWMLAHEPKNAGVYLQNKLKLLAAMNAGDQLLKERALMEMTTGLEHLIFRSN